MKKLLMLLVLVLSGCTGQAQSSKPTVYTTVKPLKDISQAILGEDYQVKSVYPADSDPHHYELTAKDMAGIAESDLFIYISDGNNSFAHDLASSGEYKTEFLNITSNSEFVNSVDSSLYDENLMPKEAEHDHDGHNHETYAGEILDPHIWVSPQKLMVIGDVLVDEFNEHYKVENDQFIKNYEIYKKELSSIDKEYQEFAKKQKYPIIVSHSAYNYLKYDYGIKSLPLYGIINEDEPTTKDIEATIDLINKEKIPAIFVEQNDLENKVIKQIAAETGVEIRTLNNMSTTNEKTLEALKDNLEALSILK